MVKNGIVATFDGIGRDVVEPKKGKGGAPSPARGRGSPSARDAGGGIKARVIEPEIISPGSTATGAPDLSGLAAMPYRYEPPPRAASRKEPSRPANGFLARLAAALGAAVAAMAIVWVVAAPALHSSATPTHQALHEAAAPAPRAPQPVQAAVSPASQDQQAGARLASVASEVFAPQPMAAHEPALAMRFQRPAAKPARVASHIKKAARADRRGTGAFVIMPPPPSPMDLAPTIAAGVMRRFVGVWP